MELARWRVQVFGKVQGVFFRKYAQMTAQSLGLVGFVRNQPDGSVLAEVQGPPEKLELFVQWTHRGSPAARVEKVEVEKNLPLGSEKEFLVTG
ncbi:MAG: acylphosphatase [Bacteroidia bacterium]|jgi:acylphosphatase|nr:acylphosphatase [Bacteroidia bacterium]GIV24030.1 MAG: acylphosphatase [Bacteroidia bacterium]